MPNILTDNKMVIDKMYAGELPGRDELKQLLSCHSKEDAEYLFKLARQVRENAYGKDVYIRGLVEFTNYCRNNCYYCGIRHSNSNACRYRLSDEDIYNCCDEGYSLGFRTFVLQGGEDMYFTKEKLCGIIEHIKKKHPDCAITLSVGERDYKDYLAWYESGADRYLLRHETASAEHYNKLHPAEMSSGHRKECLWQLKDIGYQTGAGFMAGSPFQTPDCLVDDLYFLYELKPHMAGIGPFIPQKDTPFAGRNSGTLEQTLFLLGITRLLLPDVLLPATTALGTIAPDGRERGLMAGANVVMPNLSPVSVRDKYNLYDNKISTGEESAQCTELLRKRIEQTGYNMVTGRGDFKKYKQKQAGE